MHHPRVRTLAATLGGVAVAGALVLAATRGAVAVAASPADAAPEIETLSRSIVFLERRFAEDEENFLAAGHLAERYVLRFQLAADGADVDRAAEIARRAVDIAPDRAAALARLAGIQLARHEFGAALAAAEAAVAHDSTSPAAQAALFDAALASGRYERGAWSLGRLPRTSAARSIRLATWDAAHGRTAAAEARLARTCDAFRAEALRGQLVAWCLTELAALRQELRGTEAARKVLADALRAQPGYRGAIEALADLAHASDDWAEARRLYASIATDAHPDIQLRLAEVHRARGDTAAAAAADARFLRLAARPGAEALHAQPLALFYAARPAMHDAALGVATRDVERRPAVESWQVLAWVRFRRGELTAALAAADSAAHWGAPSPTSQYRRARILAALGRAAEARPLMEAALARPDLLDADVRIELHTASAVKG